MCMRACVCADACVPSVCTCDAPRICRHMCKDIGSALVDACFAEPLLCMSRLRTCRAGACAQRGARPRTRPSRQRAAVPRLLRPRGVQAENVLFVDTVESGHPLRVKLIDFGLAGRATNKVTGCFGSRGFIAPEVVLGGTHTVSGRRRRGEQRERGGSTGGVGRLREGRRRLCLF